MNTVEKSRTPATTPPFDGSRFTAQPLPPTRYDTLRHGSTLGTFHVGLTAQRFNDLCHCTPNPTRSDPKNKLGFASLASLPPLRLAAITLPNTGEQWRTLADDPDFRAAAVLVLLHPTDVANLWIGSEDLLQGHSDTPDEVSCVDFLEPFSDERFARFDEDQEFVVSAILMAATEPGWKCLVLDRQCPAPVFGIDVAGLDEIGRAHV